MEGVIYTVVASTILAIVAFVVGRFSLKTKVQIKVEDHECRLKKIEEADALQTEGVFVLLQVAKSEGKINGDNDELFERFSRHLFKRPKG